jgi:hypothetical protein
MKTPVDDFIFPTGDSNTLQQMLLTLNKDLETTREIMGEMSDGLYRSQMEVGRILGYLNRLTARLEQLELEVKNKGK